MKHKFKKLFSLIICSALLCLLLTGCGEDPALDEFMTKMDAVCTNIYGYDSLINNIDTTKESSKSNLVSLIQKMSVEYKNLSEIDYPKEFEYLKSVADEGYNYIVTASESFAQAFEGEEEDLLMFDYAYENYQRAFKRVNVILSFIHGEKPDDVSVETQN